MSSQLQAELKQHKPFSCLEQEAHLSIARTAAVLEHAMAEALRPHDLTPTQYNALRILRGAGEQGLCRNEVRDRLIARVPDATRLLDRLEEMGHVTRVRERDDRRYVRAHLSRGGADLLRQLDTQVVASHHRLLGHLGPRKLKLLIELLADARNMG